MHFKDHESFDRPFDKPFDKLKASSKQAQNKPLDKLEASSEQVHTKEGHPLIAQIPTDRGDAVPLLSNKNS